MRAIARLRKRRTPDPPPCAGSAFPGAGGGAPALRRGLTARRSGAAGPRTRSLRSLRQRGPNRRACAPRSPRSRAGAPPPAAPRLRFPGRGGRASGRSAARRLQACGLLPACASGEPPTRRRARAPLSRPRPLRGSAFPGAVVGLEGDCRVVSDVNNRKGIGLTLASPLCPSFQFTGMSLFSNIRRFP